MDRMWAFIGQLVALVRRGREAAELDEELRHHLDMEIQANLRRGLSPPEARRQALLAFGGTDWWAERVRDERGGRWLEDLARDLRVAARTLRKRPAFAVAAALTLSLGIGMTTTMFVLVDAVLLRPLPGSRADGMVYLAIEAEDGRVSASPTPELLNLVREYATSFTRIEAYTGEDLDLEIDGEPVRARGARASVGFFSFLGVAPRLGRTFLPHDGLATANPVVVLSHRFWTERFGGSRTVLGRTLRVGDRVHEIVGVLPRDFRVDTPVEALVWIPEDGAAALLAEGTPVEGALGRLAEGVSLETARAELDAIVHNHALERMADLGWVGRLHRPADLVDPRLKRAILVLQGAALLVLLVGCGNLTNLLLAQGETRSREFAVRVSLGARRGRLVRQLLAESALLGVLGGVGGVLLTLWALASLPLFLPAGFGGVAPNAAVLVFATAVALASVGVVGLLPAARASKRELAEVIKGGAPPPPLRRRVGVRQLLVTAEVAMTVFLLVGAGLLLKSFAGLVRMDPGFDPHDLLALHVELPEDRYPDVEARGAFVRRLEREIGGRLPARLGAATLASGLVEHLSATFRPLAPEGRMPDESEPLLILTWNVAPGAFELLGLPILQGRAFTEDDGAGGERTVIIDEAAALRYFSGVDPVGRRIRLGDDAYRVVGVSRSIRLPTLAQHQVGQLQLFFPMVQNPGAGVTVLVRVRNDPSAVVRRLEETVWDVDGGLPVDDVAMVDDQMAESLGQQRSTALLMALFSVTALLLGAVGIYGVVAYSVSRRIREMGIRRALGASAGNVVSRTVLGGMRAAVVGMILGTGGALLLGRTFSGLLHEVDPRDPLVFALVITVTAAVSLLSTWIPARRAAGFGPVEALRVD